MTVDTYFGYSRREWETAREAARLILIDRATSQETISYSELVARVPLHPPLEPDSCALAHMLGEISRMEDEAGFGLLSVIVVHKDGDMMPGAGFFELAENLGKRVEDRTEFWVKELQRVYAERKQPSP
jgi:hypothetical protein